ncbi:MAG: DoxX family membrane protein [Actinomycetota bacterium]
MTTQATPAAPADGAAAYAVPMLRIVLGVIILATWWGNVRDELYTADGLTGLIDWLFTEAPDGNGSTLGFYQSILDAVVVPIAGVVATVQLVVEFLFGLGLLLGAFTRLSSLLALGFFVSLFLGYFGGEEWIWTYVLLGAAAVTVFLGWGGRRLGVDQALAARRGPSPAGILW